MHHTRFNLFILVYLIVLLFIARALEVCGRVVLVLLPRLSVQCISAVQACRWLGMASKDLCEVCKKPFYGKQKFIRCGKCDLRFHCNCLQTGVMETSVSASTGKSTYKCDSCKKLTGIPQMSIPLLGVIRRKNYPQRFSVLLRGLGIMMIILRLQLEAVRENGICCMELVQSLVVMVSKLSCEVQQLRIDETLKTQLRDLWQVPSHVPST
jgi:hypothetical protein